MANLLESTLTIPRVIAHECGHQSFSESEFWNNFFGTILHSLLLVPYHSWRITHGNPSLLTMVTVSLFHVSQASRQHWIMCE